MKVLASKCVLLVIFSCIFYMCNFGFLDGEKYLWFSIVEYLC